jgi:uncharacterized protein YpmB
MFKSVFSKYLLAFIAIILISFLMLSGIITSMVRTYAMENKENQLQKTTASIVDHFEDKDIEQLETYIDTMLPAYVITPLINREEELDIIIVDENGRVLLSTIGAEIDEEDDTRRPITGGDLGKIDITMFSKSDSDSDRDFLIHRGTLNGFLPESSIVCAERIYTN